MGDMCGKGAEAAAVLTFERYTIRALAMHETRLSGILAGLNKAMLRQRRESDDHRFCTIAYARLETEGDAERSARVIISCGGHSVRILLLKADGSIHRIVHPGRAIGVFDDANLTEQETYLVPGDALVLYTRRGRGPLPERCFFRRGATSDPSSFPVPASMLRP